MTIEPRQLNTRRRRKRLVVGVSLLVLLVMLIVVATPRLLRLPRLWTVTHNDTFNASLKATKVEFQLPEHPGGIEFNTGYSTFNLPSSPSNRRYSYGAIRLEGASFACLILVPYTDASNVYESGFNVESELRAAVDAGDSTKLPQIMSTYEHILATLNVESPSIWEALTMDGDDFDLRLSMVTMKAIQLQYEKGFSTFETQDVRGILGHGKCDGVGIFDIALWDRHSNLAQGILIDCETPEQALELAGRLAATYRFTIDQLPSDDELAELIETHVEATEMSD